MKRAALAVVLLLAACSGGDEPAAEEGRNLLPPLDLETAAIERGMVRDPANTEIAGLYSRDTDRLCIVHEGVGYKIGAFVDYGDGITCSASGTVSRVGETMHVELGDKAECGFDARFDGNRIHFPGQVPDGCEALCSGRASFAGFAPALLSESETEAASVRDPKGRLLCATDG
ncbi:hypothetical protein [Stakelama tenebrarum]|uniref:Lipoprotein n=1 Tax=Stakelama tenebrarum TaxID=2711215 RepID=A0A6G6Y7R3_9SPHN|nr:hypothetical protein [Sphingosinithalassobacter tenebrarum]QIG80613.1 hypothetical protein G5C33_13020 [Sphingosinithalassobacter tenebrarum]